MAACIAHIYAATSSIQIYPGNSGSPVMNSSGDVVGIIFAGDNRTNYGSYVPVFKIREFLERF
jgi:V8-like Glu-specific endopeptidase